MNELSWSALAPTFIGIVQIFFLAYISIAKREIVAKLEEGRDALDGLEKQINSNMERQINASINAAIANERLRVVHADKEKL